MTKSSLAAVVLCGGSSTRMGIDKARLPFGEKTFLECVLEQLSQSTVKPIVLVTNPDQGIKRTSEFDYVNLVDNDPTKGPIEGIRVGLKYLAEQGVKSAFVTSCDVPMLKPVFISYLFARFRDDDDCVVPLREARNDQDQRRVYGISAIYRTYLHETISDLIEHGQLRVSDISDNVTSRKVKLDEIRQFDPELDSLQSINSKEQYLALLERVGQTCPTDVLARLK